MENVKIKVRIKTWDEMVEQYGWYCEGTINLEQFGWHKELEKLIPEDRIIEVIEKYTRSVKFKFKFDKYEVEKIIFIPIESAPMSIKEKLNNTLEKLVYNTFVEDGRRDVIKQMYDDKRNYINSQLKTIVGKIKEIDSNG